ncbi:MAG: hypothetical protein WCJ37_00330 [Syntrophus sp. (in: bacteria)]
MKRSNIDKERGISPVTVFRVLVTLAFTGKNLFCTLDADGSCGMAKDTVYIGFSTRSIPIGGDSFCC